VLAGIGAARLQLGERINPLGANEIWAIVQESLRRIAMALILAVLFAGYSQLPGSQLSLLGSFNAVLDEGFQRRLQARHDRRRRREERIRFRDHLEAEARARQEQETPPDPRLDFAHQAQDLLLHTLLLQHDVRMHRPREKVEPCLDLLLWCTTRNAQNGIRALGRRSCRAERARDDWS
jgi:hypothetical protein